MKENGNSKKMSLLKQVLIRYNLFGLLLILMGVHAFSINIINANRATAVSMPVPLGIVIFLVLVILFTIYLYYAVSFFTGKVEKHDELSRSNLSRAHQAASEVLILTLNIVLIFSCILYLLTRNESNTTPLFNGLYPYNIVHRDNIFKHIFRNIRLCDYLWPTVVTIIGVFYMLIGIFYKKYDKE